MKSHPYKHLPDVAFWRRSVAGVNLAEVDPVGEFTLKLTQVTKVATAGSCFAQHIARHLKKSGYHYYVTEPGHPIIPIEILTQHGYGTFSARYGNIYTTRQLLQLLKRAYGQFMPAEDCWTDENGTVKDPYRPTVQPGGFISIAEMRADRVQHLAAVRKLFETLDVFVFTFGLTECWMSKQDGAVFPICPGVDGGVFDPEKHIFHNQDVTEVIADMSEFIDRLKAVNPGAEVILTVSPVPLMATAQAGAHVLAATSYSKSVLRVAADTLSRTHDFVHYFPSYEIITGAFNRGIYYAEGLRDVTEAGVEHVMRIFFRHATDGHVSESIQQAPTTEDETLKLAQQIVDVECDERLLDS